MAAQARHVPWLGRLLVTSATLLALLLASAYVHAVGDGAPSVAASLLLPRAVDVDPWSAAWFPMLMAGLVAYAAAWRRIGPWVPLTGLGMFGAYFFSEGGWILLGLTLGFAWAFAAGAAPVGRR